VRRHLLAFPFALVILLLVGVTASVARPVLPPQATGPDRTLTVMTRNLYFGADLTPVITATSEEEFLSEAVEAFQTALASDFPARASAIADEIVAEEPALVGIQEATWWRTSTLTDPPQPVDELSVDFVGLILEELAERGASYEAIEIVEGFDAEAAVEDLGVNVRLTVGDVMLARTDLPTSQLKISNVQSGTYDTKVVLPTPIGELEFPRQWISADVKVRGTEARVITTHLESIAAPFRIGQAMELLAGPADTSLPVVAIGDFNAEITAEGDASALMLDAGFEDAWEIARPGEDGLTCCQEADLRNPVSALTSRIDLILVRGDFGVDDIRVFGDEPQPDLSDLGVLYPSDHAGVVADLVLPRQPSGRPGR
jgi:endonuclease/exonuclease/phosphatase family metal-dependent hydrolase